MKIKTLLLVFILSIVSTIAQAMERPSLGGIYLGSSLEYIESIYGPANLEESKPLYTYRSDDYTYGQDKSVAFSIISFFKPTDQFANGLASLQTNKNNGFSTPEGIHVGSPLEEALDLYGENASFYEFENAPIIYAYTESIANRHRIAQKVAKNHKLKGFVEICYGDDAYQIFFSNGIITSIILSYPIDFE